MIRQAISTVTLALTLAAAPAFAGEDAAAEAPVNVGPAVNTDKTGVAIGGYDPVAYFHDGEAVKGDFTIASTVGDATYWFDAEDHKALFDADPHRYLPQYGGYCAFGAALGKKFNADPHVFSIVDGKLYLNLNDSISEKFADDSETFIRDADTNWADIAAVPAQEL